ncbi:sporulation integral membrane protein YtvI [Cohnella lubricantis]|uniref:Sporulation integral membrane protein YtvI n=1 Tax=Cohnella lubricantis TaxID=2163172 RepID=A0A841T9C4_9BACL|nr:sporulation integral membrane protein YtvI [Cohnella lubricantis]MBB6676028.1 sporulation integral membrane protein YtvI [Cohnella lubricantis]MBP2117959.1 sporulation integral membrane protein YtvI [Cohnella lubricantis]
MDRQTSGQWLRLAATVAASIGLLIAIGWALPLVYPFVLGWLLAYALNPLVNFLHQSARLPRWLAVTLTLMLFTLSMLTVVSAFVMRLVNEIMNLSGSLQRIIGGVERTINGFIARPDIQSLIERLNAFYRDNPNYQETINGRIADTTRAIAAAGSNLIAAVLNGIVTVLTSLPQVATITVVALLASFFISKDWNRYLNWAVSWCPKPLRQRVGAVSRDLRHALMGYIRAQLIMISITAIVVVIGLWIIGIPDAVSIGLLIGFIDLLPYLGVGAVMVPWIAYQYIVGDWRLGTALSILYGIVLIARQIIEPKVLATSVGLDPLPTLIAMFVGLKLFGFLGLIIGPVAIVVMTACYRANVFRDIGRFILHGGRLTK